MEALALYLFKVHVAVSLLYAVYYVAVKNEHFFRLNRVILLGIILISFGLPLLPQLLTGQANPTADQSIGASLNSPLANQLSGDLLKGKEISRLPDEIQVKRMSGLIISILAFYLCGTGFFLVRFVGQILSVIFLIKSSERVFGYSRMFRDPGEDIAAFSFFGAIVIHRGQHNENELRQIIAHEKAHAKQWHSIDILLSEFAYAILWCNPAVKALKGAIRLNLEFLADQAVLRRGFDKQEYQWSILVPYLKQQAFPLTNLYSSRPKLRIEKMNAPGSSFLNLYKYAILLPVLAFVYAFIVPFHAIAFDRIQTMHLIDEHEYRDYLGYYEFDYDKGIYLQIAMKDESLVMKTLWNNKKIYFRKKSDNAFINKEAAIPLTFPRDRDGRITNLVAFGNEEWTKVKEYKPVVKRAGEGTVISRTASGGMQVLVYAIEPWANVKNYTVKNGESGP